MFYLLSIVLPHAVLQEVQECHPLAFGAGADRGVVGSHDRTCHRTSSPERHAQIGAGQLRDNLFKGPEKEHFVLNDWPADRSAKLVAAKVLEGFAIRGGRGQRFGAEIFEAASVDIIRSRLGNDVDNATSSAPEFRVGPAGDDLEFLDRVECDVYCSALAAELLAKKAVVVVSAIEADVIEHAALSVEIDFVAV